MKMRRTDTFEEELRDPELAALLQDAFADDPALAEAPGRTERIMRRVLTTGVRPAPAPWLAWGWATGLAAAAAVVVMLLFGMQQAPNVAKRDDLPPVPKEQPAPAPRTPLVVAHPPAPAPAPTPPALKTPVEQPRREWRQPETPKPHTPDPTPAPAPPVLATVPPPAAEPTAVAAALYTAGSAAQTVGDYETAYEAYAASYETVPNPETLLAASDALLLMARDTSGSDG
jgi:hypothetical protein